MVIITNHEIKGIYYKIVNIKGKEIKSFSLDDRQFNSIDFKVGDVFEIDGLRGKFRVAERVIRLNKYDEMIISLVSEKLASPKK